MGEGWHKNKTKLNNKDRTQNKLHYANCLLCLSELEVLVLANYFMVLVMHFNLCLLGKSIHIQVKTLHIELVYI